MATSPAKPASSSAASSSPRRGAGLDPQLAASSSPRTSGGARAVRAPAQRLAEQLARELEVARDRLVGLAPARGQPVGDREHGHVDLHGLGGRAGSGRPARRDERALVDEEPEAQVMARERRDVALQALGGAQARERRRGRARAPATSWPMNVDAALGRLGARARLGGVVQQRAEAQRLAPRQVVGERLGQQRRDRRLGVARPAPARGRARARSRASSTASVWLVDVEVVVVALLDAAQRGQLGQHDRRGAPSSSISASPRARRRAQTTRLSSAKTRSRATPASRAARAARGGARVRVGLEPQLAREADHAQRRAAGRRRTRPAATMRSRRASRSRAPAERIDQVVRRRAARPSR